MSLRLARSDTAARLGRYALTGGAAAAVDLGGFLLIAPHVAPVLLAAALSFAAAAAVNYALSSAFAFRAATSWRGFALFLGFALIGLAVNAGITGLAAWGGAPLALAKTAGIGIAFGFNFAANHFIVFPRTR